MRLVKTVKLIPNASPVLEVGTKMIVTAIRASGTIYAKPYDDVIGPHSRMTHREYCLYQHEYEVIE